MKFLTLLSQPVGSFSSVELLDEDTPADIFHLNFCNTDAPNGTISVSSSSAYPVQAEKLLVRSGATLGGDVDFFRLNSSNTSTDGNGTISIGSSANFRGGTLEVDTTAPAKILVDDGAERSGSAEFIHGNAVTIKTADFYRMNISNTAVLNTPASGSTHSDSLSWKQVPGLDSESAANKNAFILTDHSGQVNDEEDDGTGDSDQDEEEDDSKDNGSGGCVGRWILTSRNEFTTSSSSYQQVVAAANRRRCPQGVLNLDSTMTDASKACQYMGHGQCGYYWYAYTEPGSQHQYYKGIILSCDCD